VHHRNFGNIYWVISVNDVLHRAMETYYTMKLCHYILTEETIMAMMNYGSDSISYDEL
jgi:hypothetical protein